MCYQHGDKDGLSPLIYSMYMPLGTISSKKSLNYSGSSLDKVLYLIKYLFRFKGGNGLHLIEIST